MVHQQARYPLSIENVYCSSPQQCLQVDVLFVGASITLSCVPYLLQQAQQALGMPLRIAVLDAGPFDLLTHMAHTAFPRVPFLQLSPERFGGKLTLWGMSTPRPPADCLRRWPYPYEDLLRRFASLETEMGICDPIPKSGLVLEAHLLERLQHRFPAAVVRPAPLAINRDGRRWCPLDAVPALVAQGVHLIPRFRCERLVMDDRAVTAVHGTWYDGSSWTVQARTVVVGVGVEASLALLRPVCQAPLRLEPADHIRIDLHGSVPAGHFGAYPADQLGVAVLLMECRSRDSHVPYHLEIKVAPRELWRRGFMTSADNLRGGAPADTSLWIQVQAIAAMHDRFPPVDLLNVASPIAPVMSAQDAAFHGEIIAVMQQVATALGLDQPTFALRPLLANHHTYGAFRVGKTVTADFRLCGVDNLYVLPPTAYVDMEDDANPVLKSRVLAQYAIDAIVRRLQAGTL